MYFALLLFGIPSMIVAEKKGFAGSRWLLTFGLIGLIVVCFLPSAKASGISREQSRARYKKANTIGAGLCGVNILLIAFGMLVYVMVSGLR